MKRMAILRRNFEERWSAVAAAFADVGDGDWQSDACREWFPRFLSLLSDTFRDVFEEAKKGLEPNPPEFAYKTVRNWCLAADDKCGPILTLVDNRLAPYLEKWDDILTELADDEIPRTDWVYKPQSELCLDTFKDLPSKSRDLRMLLSQIHPFLTRAMKNVLSGVDCATLEEALETFPVLRGLKEDELRLYRGSTRQTEIESAKELLYARLKAVIGVATLDKYFRPTPFRPR